jgi:glycosyltransferase involved in cell wall biosynthesis
LFPVSVVIVTKDEDQNIEDALKSVADAKEIIVVDAFSKDKTVEI